MPLFCRNAAAVGHELVELAARRSARERGAGTRDALAQGGRKSRHVDAGTRVEGHDVTRCSLLVLQRTQYHRLGLLDIGNPDRIVALHAQPEVLRRDLILANLAVLELAHHGWAADRDLVEPLQAVHDEDAPAAEPLQHARLDADEVR